MRRKKRNSQRLTCCLTWIAVGCSWSFSMDSALLVNVQLLHHCLIYCILLMFFILGSSSSKLLSYLLSDFYTDTAAADYHLPKSWQAPLTPVPVANMELDSSCSREAHISVSVCTDSHQQLKPHFLLFADNSMEASYNSSSSEQHLCHVDSLCFYTYWRITLHT